MKLYNSLTRKKEEFTTIKTGKVLMYSCGPTVYNFAHIGNLRTYVFMDILRRVLKLNKYKIKGVLNVTDVGHLLSDADEGEDKMAIAAKEQKKSPWQIAEEYLKVFLADCEKLNIDMPELIIKVTDHIQAMIDYVLRLIENGFAYETADGIYYDTQKFEQYGMLSGQKLEDKQAGARIAVNSEKRSPQDFAVWKKAEPNHIMQWPSPWGMGYPGWHIECSALIQKFLGGKIDIHTGGVDHVPVHHENEIAQAFGYDMCCDPVGGVNYWLHGEFMLVDGGKMSKSLGNTYTIAQLEERGYTAMDFKYFCYSAHYRKKLNFTFDGLEAAKKANENLVLLLVNHSKSLVDTGVDYTGEFVTAVNDDLNVPLGLGVLWKAAKGAACKGVYRQALEFDKVLGLGLKAAVEKKIAELAVEVTVVVPAEIMLLGEKRATAKAEKNWAEADRLRGEIESAGYKIVDRAGGGFEVF